MDGWRVCCAVLLSFAVFSLSRTPHRACCWRSSGRLVDPRSVGWLVRTGCRFAPPPLSDETLNRREGAAAAVSAVCARCYVARVLPERDTVVAIVVVDSSTSCWCVRAKFVTSVFDIVWYISQV
uniref:Putative secreted protein n=1 Tax=Anopheles marajoara TaxID=58244 RepID=A0A2M4C7N5_9DIPT